MFNLPCSSQWMLDVILIHEIAYLSGVLFILRFLLLNTLLLARLFNLILLIYGVLIVVDEIVKLYFPVEVNIGSLWFEVIIYLAKVVVKSFDLVFV
jgi:hypothetical protein